MTKYNIKDLVKSISTIEDTPEKSCRTLFQRLASHDKVLVPQGEIRLVERILNARYGAFTVVFAVEEEGGEERFFQMECQIHYSAKTAGGYDGLDAIATLADIKQAFSEDGLTDEQLEEDVFIDFLEVRRNVKSVSSYIADSKCPRVEVSQMVRNPVSKEDIENCFPNGVLKDTSELVQKSMESVVWGMFDYYTVPLDFRYDDPDNVVYTHNEARIIKGETVADFIYPPEGEHQHVENENEGRRLVVRNIITKDHFEIRMPFSSYDDIGVSRATIQKVFHATFNTVRYEPVSPSEGYQVVTVNGKFTLLDYLMYYQDFLEGEDDYDD